MTKNALIVDDTTTMRKIIMRGIRPAGINHAEFQAAGDEDPGLEADVDTASDLILSDVEMPNIDDLDNAQAMTETLDPPSASRQTATLRANWQAEPVVALPAEPRARRYRPGEVFMGEYLTRQVKGSIKAVCSAPTVTTRPMTRRVSVCNRPSNKSVRSARAAMRRWLV